MNDPRNESVPEEEPYSRSLDYDRVEQTIQVAFGQLTSQRVVNNLSGVNSIAHFVIACVVAALFVYTICAHESVVGD